MKAIASFVIAILVSGCTAVAANGPGQQPDPQSFASSTSRLECSGRGGQFQILAVSRKDARFQFTTKDPIDGHSCTQIFQVQTSSDRDPKRDIVKGMLEIISATFGDEFRWESTYLGRVVVLTCRPAEREACVDFLMRDFYGERRMPPSP